MLYEEDLLQNFVGKREEMRDHRRTRCEQEDNIKMNPVEQDV